MQKLLNKDNENLNKVLNQSPSYASEICHVDSITIDDDIEYFFITVMEYNHHFSF